VRSTTSDSNFTSIGTSTTTTYTDNTAVNGTTYYYAVVAINGGGQSNPSLQASATLIPNVPQNVVATGGISQVVLSWTASPGATSYNVYRSTTIGAGYTTIASPTSATYTDTSGTAGTTYYYVVTAVNNGGESGTSSQVDATPEPPIAAAPTGLIASPGNALVGLSWTASSGATTYNVKRSTTSGSGYVTIGNTSVVMFTDSSAVNGTTYYYVVSAVNGGGESANSAQAGATPQISTALLPAPWLDQDINTGVTGSASYSSGVYTISASGMQIWSTTDGFHFIYRTLIGDGVMIARVKTGGSSSKTGIMMRQALTANSDYVDAVMNGGPNSAKTEYRATPGASATSASSTPSNDVELNVPYWVKLVRTGNVFTAYRAPDGATWTQTGGSVTIAMSDPIDVGLVQTSDSNSTLATATFDNVTMLASPTHLSATPLSQSQLQLNWQNNPGSIVTDATACTVQRSLTGDNSWTTLTNNLGPTSTSYLDTGATAANTYDYRVACFNSLGISAYATVTATTGAITSSLTSGGSTASLFSYQITADNDANSFAATGLPNGLTLNATTGLISGTPSVSGNFPVIISATNTTTGDTVTATLTLNLAGPDSTDTPTMPPFALVLLALLLFAMAAKLLPAVSPAPASPPDERE
jgi:fibronectin type 3 domain-containing protein